MSRLMVFGASITWGAYDVGGGWVDRLKTHYIKMFLSDKCDEIYIYNLGVSGNTTKRLVKRFGNEISSRMKTGSQTVVVVCLGTADSEFLNSDGTHNVKPEVFRGNILSLIEIGKSLNAKLVFVGLNPVNEKVLDPLPWKPTVSLKNKFIKMYESIIAEVCAENGVKFIPIFERIFEKDYLDLLVDGVHLNSKGHKCVFDLVKDTFDDLIIKRNE